MILVAQMFFSSPSHGLAHGLLGHFLFVCPPVFVSWHVSRSVDDVLPSCLAFPAAGGVEALLVRPRKLGGVREAAHCRGSHSSLGGTQRFSFFSRYKISDSHPPYRDSWNDGRLPLYQLEDLSLSLLAALLFVLLPGQLRQRGLEIIIRDVAAGFLPKKWVQREINHAA